MLRIFNKAVIVYKPVDECLKLANIAVRELKESGVEVFLLTVDDISPMKRNTAEFEAVDLAISIGGDGTFMRTAKTFITGSLVLPYPCGRRNVYYEYGMPSMDKVIKNVLSGGFFLELLPEYKVCHEQRCLQFLNDVVIASSDLGKVSKYTIELVSIPMESSLTFEGDGVIICTAGGSGGHNLSARGPIVAPILEALIVTPMNPLQVGLTSVVMPALAKISIKVKNKARVYVDGDFFLELERGGRVDLPGDLSYVKVIRLKPFRDLLRAVFESRKHIFY